jgi:hypothetical protein
VVNIDGPIYFFTYEKTELSEKMRINGSKTRITSFLDSLKEDPRYRLEFHEALAVVTSGCWSCLLTVHLVPASVAE